MALAESPLVAALGIVSVLAVFGITYWDAARIDTSRPLLWAVVTAGTLAAGFFLFLFVPDAPLTGVIMTANTGSVLYTFEREVTTEDDEPAEPGTLPHEPAGSGSLESSERPPGSNDE
ncbi:hypothetical protein [Haloterrigena alkaliphila]|uniref:Uncharacterized protein n=1 Tax=Haloterrigena alkaliphila TaxID=2816475 RepID=A0A8A2VG92_9EURY|nr:hypothetical protein [Haloterrigena alkaliphila]QSW99710.1 hypothetical protein J0X25_01735 [Haloterrigena alkaliphila]